MVDAHADFSALVEVVNVGQLRGQRTHLLAST